MFADFDLNALLKNNDIQPRVQKHLMNVYLALSACMLCCVFGAYCNIRYHIGSSALWFFVSFGLMYWLRSDRYSPYQNTLKRMSILCGFGFVQGLTLGGLVEFAYFLDPNIIYMAITSTIVIFLSFSGAALLAKRRSYLYLGGMLSSALFVMSISSLMNAFIIRSELMQTIHVLIGTLACSGFIIFDTQMIIERASFTANNGFDYAGDALHLFTDVINVFIYVVRLLMEKNRREKRKNQARNGYR